MSSTALKQEKLQGVWWLKEIRDLAPKLVLGTSIMLVLELSVRNGIVGTLGRNSTLSFFMMGSFVIHMWTRPGWRQILGVLGIGIVLALGYVQFWGGPDLSLFVTASSFLGVGSLTVAAIVTLLAKDADRQAKIETLGAACVLPFMWIVTAPASAMTTKLYVRAYDLSLYAFDASLGIQPSFWMGQLFQNFHPVQKVSEIVYFALPLDVSFLYAWHRTRKRPMPVNVLLMFVTTSGVGFLLYYFFPASGPVYAFPKLFPWNPPDLRSLAIVPIAIPVAPRNAMPSLHTAAALLVFWNSYGWSKWARVATASFLLFTLLATLGFGEHYLIDLIVAVPLSLALQAGWTTGISWRAPERRQAVIAGSAGVVVWFLLLYLATPLFLLSPVVGWLLIAVTIVPSLWMRRRLLGTVTREFQGLRPVMGAGSN